MQDLMRIGEITSDCETSVDNDAGRMRLSSHYRDNAVRFVVDTTGTILEQTKFSAGIRTPKRQSNHGNINLRAKPALDWACPILIRFQALLFVRSTLGVIGHVALDYDAVRAFQFANAFRYDILACP